MIWETKLQLFHWNKVISKNYLWAALSLFKQSFKELFHKEERNSDFKSIFEITLNIRALNSQPLWTLFYNLYEHFFAVNYLAFITAHNPFIIYLIAAIICSNFLFIHFPLIFHTQKALINCVCLYIKFHWYFIGFPSFFLFFT